MPESHLMHRLLQKPTPRQSEGFTLTELAVVMVIIALLLGGLLIPLSTQQEIERRKETAAQLNTIREALISHVLIYGRLPCPDYDNDPAAAGYGQADEPCSAPTADAASDGFLPWKTLGVTEHDAWGTPWQDAAAPRLGHWRYRVERDYTDNSTPGQLTALFVNNSNDNVNACTAGTAPPAFPKDCIAVWNTAGQTLFALKERPIAVIYSVGANGQADGQNNSYEANRGASPTYQADTPSVDFDDQLIWLTRNTLVAPLVAVGKLP